MDELTHQITAPGLHFAASIRDAWEAFARSHQSFYLRLIQVLFRFS
jgi:hypothetical protein